MSRIPDPFLARHHGRGLVFALFGHNPQSIRDQMIRAVMLVDRARRMRIIGPDRPPLVVVGAGAAGATAAVLAATTYKIHTHLIERNEQPFMRQRTFASRYVCPTQYDFPVHHWPEATFPWEPPYRIPLGWDAGSAHSISSQWKDRFDELAKSDSGEEFLHIETQSENYRTEAFDHLNRTMMVSWEQKGDIVRREAGMTILASGFGKERCCYPDDDPQKMTATVGPRFRGPDFWASDQLEEPVYDEREIKREDAVIVISGGGDGGLQDMLRTCFGKPARRIFDTIFLKSSSSTQMKDLRREILETIGAAEDQNHRAAFMAGTAADRERLLQELHKKHLAMIDKIAKGALFQDIKTRLRLIRVPSDPKALYFIHGDDYFSQSYGLNRFLVALLLHDDFRPPWIHPKYGKRVQSVSGREGHICKNSAEECFARPHLVTLEDAQKKKADADSEPPAPSLTIKADIVILRHGFYNEDGEPVEMIQDVMPYSLPGF